MLALLNVENLLANGGLLMLGAIVFAESGLLIGFFLPGDSLLFIAGFLASSAGNNVLPPVAWVILVSVTMAILGDQVGYLIGKKIGPALFDKPKSRLFNPAHAVKANNFFTKYGARTIVLARFVPIVRTFAPVVAGVGSMEYKTFLRYNVIGGVAWGAGIPLLGYFLGQITFIKNHIEIAIVVIVFVSLLPVIVEIVKHRRSQTTPVAK